MRICVPLFISMLALDTFAGEPHYVYPYNWMAAGELVRKLTAEPVSEQDFLQRELANHYLNGIKDGSQGKDWCFKEPILPHELNLELAHAIKKSLSSARSKENAAPVFIAELKKRYPCIQKNGGLKRPV